VSIEVWYSGGWSSANGDVGAPGVQLLRHLRSGHPDPDRSPAPRGGVHPGGQSGTLKVVSFIKPVGEENEHPSYTGVNGGELHLVKQVQAIDGGRNGKHTLIIVTYDELGGAWDHVPPPNGRGPSGDAPVSRCC
jgi:phospholipase C